MRTIILAFACLAPLAGCQSDSTGSGMAMSGCPADVSQADRYKYPDCDKPQQASACPVDVSEADRYKYPACQ